jgi:hypothetical protein
MDRCAIMVDAGYVYAAGGILCCDTPSRGVAGLDDVKLRLGRLNRYDQQRASTRSSTAT